MNEQTISLDVTKRPAITPVLYIRQGDAHGTTLNAEMYDNGVALNLANYSVRFAMRTPNGSGYYEVDGSTSGNVASFVIDETYAGSVSGVTDVAYVEVIGTDTAHTSSGSLRVVVLPSATEDTDPAGAYVNGVDRWLANAQLSLMNMENAANAEVDSAIGRLDDAVADVDGAVSRANAAAAAAEGVVVDAVPLMSKTVHGGAKLGHGLRVSAGALGVQLVDSGSGTATVQADGDYLHALEVDGKSEQRTTTGKNLLMPNPNYMSYADDTFVNTSTDSRTMMHLNCYTYDASGEQVSYVAATISSPGKYSLEMTVSTTTARAYVKHNGGTRDLILVKSDTPCVLQPGTYTISLEVLSADPTTVGGLVIKNLQLEAGSTATAYEPYTGGKASPSPDYPQEVRTVKGINLFDNDGATWNGVGASNMAKQGNGVKFSAIASTGSQYAYDTAKGYGSGTFTYSHVASSVYSRMFVRIRKKDDSGWMTSSDVTMSGMNYNSYYSGWFVSILNMKNFTFTVPDCAYWNLGIGFDSAATAPQTIDNIQLERGTTAHDFVPYGALGLKVTGKNRMPKFVPGIYSQNGITIKVDDDNTVHLNGTTTASLNLTIPLEETVPIDLAGKYIHLRNGGTNANMFINLQPSTAAVNTDSFGLSVQNRIVAATALMVTQLKTIGSARFYLPASNTIDFSLRMSIEEDSTATEYAPYVDGVTPIPLNGNVLASLPDGTHDELAIDDAGHALVKRNVGVYEYDGSNDEVWHVEYNSTFGMLNFYIGAPLSERNTVNLLCNMSMRGTAATTQPAGLVFVSSSGNANFPFGNRIGITDQSTALEDFVAWLATHIMYLHYPLATPQTIDLGYIDMPKLSEGNTIELLASIDPPIDAEWWAVGAGAVHESNVAWGAKVDAAVAELAEAIADL